MSVPRGVDPKKQCSPGGAGSGDIIVNHAMYISRFPVDSKGCGAAKRAFLPILAAKLSKPVNNRVNASAGFRFHLSQSGPTVGSPSVELVTVAQTIECTPIVLGRPPGTMMPFGDRGVARGFRRWRR